ncbi:hypothetical protein [Aestuariivirga sp.]|uniref:hypothetical protein n=1 Tax=Aestuariivirga sp. TaxID=2650926 RepID=UPI0039E4A03F
MRNEFSMPSRIFQVAPEPIADSYWRRCHRVLHMLGVLHGKGFHGLRIFPHNYPLAYRIEIYSSLYMSADGVKYRPEAIPTGVDSRIIARHSGADGASFFGWDDAQEANAQQLALLFISRFPDLCRESYRLDFAYAGWFATLLAHCDYGFLPYLFAENEEEIGVLRMNQIGGGGLEYFPLPPGTNFGQTFVPVPSAKWLK